MSAEIESRINSRIVVIASAVITIFLGIIGYMVVSQVDRVNDTMLRMEDKGDLRWKETEQAIRILSQHMEVLKQHQKDIDRLDDAERDRTMRELGVKPRP